METIGRIRREHFLKGKTIKEIARDLKVSRNTVRRVLRSGETSFEYEREVQPRPKLGRWTAELDELLASNAAKAAREQLTLIRVFEELRGRGYDGGYDAVRRYARRWAKERGQSAASAYVPLSFAPGEAYQFDWSHEVVLLSGVTVIVKAAHVRLCEGKQLGRPRIAPALEERIRKALATVALTPLFANKLLIRTAEGTIRLRAWISPSRRETDGTRVLAVHCLRVTSNPTRGGRCIYGWRSLRHRRNSLTGLSEEFGSEQCACQ